MSHFTQVQSAKNIDLSRIRFNTAIQGTVPGGATGMGYQRIPISYENSDGTIGDLVMLTDRLFSFGVGENSSPETGVVNGHTMSLAMWTKDNPTDSEKEWTNKFDSICELCTEYILNNKEDLQKFELEPSDLKKFNPFYRRKEKVVVNGKTQMQNVPGCGPTLYTKLIFSKKSDKFITCLYDVNDEPINPLDMIGKFCYVRAAVKLESIFVGNKISFQVKLCEGVVELIQSGPRRMIRPMSNPVVADLTTPQKAHEFASVDSDEESDDDIVDTKEAVVVTPALVTPLKKTVPYKKK
jgi:hypothetical protein